MNNIRERRTFIRVDLPVDCIVIHDGARMEAECLNISATGMSLNLENGSLSIDDIIEIKLDDSDEDLPPLDAKAKVIRIIDAKTKKYGIQFLTSTKE